MATTKRKAPPKAPAAGGRAARGKGKEAAAVAAPAAKAKAKAAKAGKSEKLEKPRKPKLVRDSFTIPKNEYGVIEDLKQRAARLGRPMKKSEVLRAGVMALAAMPDAAFLASVGTVPTVKTGRPAKA